MTAWKECPLCRGNGAVAFLDAGKRRSAHKDQKW